jgi:hypothetical protein
MSSIVRQYSQVKAGLTKFSLVDGPSYNDRSLLPDPYLDLLIPFTFNRDGILDINFIDGFVESTIDLSGGCPPPSNECRLAIRVCGSQHLVRGLGNNFKTYIRAWRADTIDEGSPITIHTPGAVVKVQQSMPEYLQDYQTYEVASNPPPSDNFFGGEPINKYRTSYCFSQPMTIVTREGGDNKYITFRSVFENY